MPALPPPPLPVLARPAPEVTFHRAVYLPHCVRLPAGEVQLVPTHHAECAAAEDGTGLPTRLDFDAATTDIVEVTTDARLRVTKLLCRVPLDSRGDLCVVLRPSPGKPGTWSIITVWINRHDDHHRTLDRTRYAPTP